MAFEWSLAEGLRSVEETQQSCFRGEDCFVSALRGGSSIPPLRLCVCTLLRVRWLQSVMQHGIHEGVRIDVNCVLVNLRYFPTPLSPDAPCAADICVAWCESVCSVCCFTIRRPLCCYPDSCTSSSQLTAHREVFPVALMSSSPIVPVIGSALKTLNF